MIWGYHMVPPFKETPIYIHTHRLWSTFMFYPSNHPWGKSTPCRHHLLSCWAFACTSWDWTLNSHRKKFLNVDRGTLLSLDIEVEIVYVYICMYAWSIQMYLTYVQIIMCRFWAIMALAHQEQTFKTQNFTLWEDLGRICWLHNVPPDDTSKEVVAIMACQFAVLVVASFNLPTIVFGISKFQVANWHHIAAPKKGECSPLEVQPPCYRLV